MSKSVYIVLHSDGWAVQLANSSDYEGIFATQEEAITLGKELALTHKTKLHVQKSNGRFKVAS